MSEEYTYEEYPRMLYHPNGSTETVTTAEEDTAAKAAGYVNSPAEYGVETCPAALPAQPGGFPAASAPRGFPQPAEPVPVPAGTPTEAAAEVAALEGEAERSRRRH